jgi:hypothetical protein
MPARLMSDFSYVKQATPITQVKVLESKPDYTVKRVELLAAPDGAETNRWIELDYYEVAAKGPAPMILVLPMLGGGYTLERYFASYFASHGYAAAIVRRDRKRTKGAGIIDLNRIFKEMVIDHKQVIDWVETQPNLDSSRVGIFGVSLGGIKGALLLPVESRIRAAALGLAGGDLPYILMHSTEPGLVKRRELEMSERHLTFEEAEKMLRNTLTFDPMIYAPYVDAKKILLVLARFDTVVPIEKGLELKTKMGNPETIMIPAGHYSAVLSIPYIKAAAFHFFEKRFAEKEITAASYPGGASHR